MELQVLQSMWGMEELPWRGAEWTLEQQVEQIREAGFDGAAVDFDDPALARRTTAALAAAELEWSVECIAASGEELSRRLELAAECGLERASHVNVQVDARPADVGAAAELVEELRALAGEAGLRLLFETHRDRMTMDLPFTLALLERAPADGAHRRPLPLRRRPRADPAGARGGRARDRGGDPARRGLPRPRRLLRADPDPDRVSPAPRVARPLPAAGGPTGSPSGARGLAPASGSASPPSSGRRSGTRSPAATESSSPTVGPKRWRCATRRAGSGTRWRAERDGDRLRGPRPPGSRQPLRRARGRDRRQRLDRARMPPARIYGGGGKRRRAELAQPGRAAELAAANGVHAFGSWEEMVERALSRGRRHRLPAARPARVDRSDLGPRRRDQGDPRPEAAGDGLRARGRGGGGLRAGRGRARGQPEHAL